MAVQSADNGRYLEVACTGSASIGSAEQWVSAFRDVQKSPSPLVRLDLGAIEDVDLTFFQILLSLEKSLRSQGRHLLVQSLDTEHPVSKQAAVLGLKLEHYLTMVEGQS
jgi:hypothetical protein